MGDLEVIEDDVECVVGIGSVAIPMGGDELTATHNTTKDEDDEDAIYE